MKKVLVENPKTIEEFVKSSWYKKVETQVTNFHLNEPVEDTMGDIILALVEKSYLERWEPSNGSYSNWIYTFTSHICMKKWNRSHTVGGSSIEGASSLSTSVDDDFVPGTCDEERTVSEETESTVIGDYNLLCSEIDKVLAPYKAHSSVTVDGVTYNRDMRTVFNLLTKDYDCKEIAELFGTSTEFIYTLIRKMRPIIKQALGGDIF